MSGYGSVCVLTHAPGHELIPSQGTNHTRGHAGSIQWMFLFLINVSLSLSIPLSEMCAAALLQIIKNVCSSFITNHQKSEVTIFYKLIYQNKVEFKKKEKSEQGPIFTLLMTSRDCLSPLAPT